MKKQARLKELRQFVLHGLKALLKTEHPIPHANRPLLFTQRNSREIILDGLNRLERENHLYADILRQRYVRGKTEQEIGVARGELNREGVKYLARKGIDALTKIVYVDELKLHEQKLADELKLRMQQRQHLQAQLPLATYETLYGGEALCEKLKRTLLSADSHLVVLTGIGGIGKTSLAREVALDIIEAHHFQELLWLSIEENSVVLPTGDAYPLALQTFTTVLLTHLDPTYPKGNTFAAHTHLRQLLQARPTLVIIDNLEDVTTAELVLNAFADFANPLKVLLTSRVRPQPRPHLTSHVLAELPRSAAFALIRSHAKTVGSPLLAAGDSDLLQKIHHAIGGNPLAIKLVVGLAAISELGRILEDLKTVQIDAIHDMYTKIYRRAWDSLSVDAQQVLLVMPLATEWGMRFDWLLQGSGLDFGRFSTALTELTQRSLLDVLGDTRNRRYAIHQLTRSFLLSDILDWDDGNVA